MTDSIAAIQIQRENTNRPRIDEQPTIVEFPVIPKSPPMSTEQMTAHMLQPTVKTREVLHFEMRDSQADTIQLVKAVMEVCLKEANKFPFRILLSPLRYLALYSYIEEMNSNSSIKLDCADIMADYDVMAMCEA